MLILNRLHLAIDNYEIRNVLLPNIIVLFPCQEQIIVSALPPCDWWAVDYCACMCIYCRLLTRYVRMWTSTYSLPRSTYQPTYSMNAHHSLDGYRHCGVTLLNLLRSWVSWSVSSQARIWISIGILKAFLNFTWDWFQLFSPPTCTYVCVCVPCCPLLCLCPFSGRGLTLLFICQIQ